MSEPRKWSELELTEAQLLYRQLRETFSTESFAAESQQAVTQICDRALLTLDDDYCQQMFCEIERQAQDLVTSQCDRRAIGFTLKAIDYRLRSLETLRSAGAAIAHAKR